MEVHVRNLPQQTTVGILNKHFKPNLQALSITSYVWKKHTDKKYASLTFLHHADGARFLSAHGQVRIPGKRPTTKILFKFNSVPVYFEQSTHLPEDSVLRGLAKEEKDRQVKVYQPDEFAGIEEFEAVQWNTTSFSCGTWAYQNHELVFVPECRWQWSGTAKFGQRSMILTSVTGHRVDFRCAAIMEIIVQKSPESIHISMIEPARFFERYDPEDDPESVLLATLLRNMNPHSGPQRNGAERARISGIDDHHATIAGHCLVYRLDSSPMAIKDFNDRIKGLSRIRVLPQAINHVIRTRYPTQPLTERLSTFHDRMASINLILPFEILFQIQKLVQNNYLPPDTVSALMPEFDALYTRSGAKICAQVIEMLFSQIDYASFEIDGSVFQISDLVEQVRENERLAKSASGREEDMEEDAGHGGLSGIDPNLYHGVSENEVMIHRARVTPAGLSLSGPETESSNRVLRKYPKYHNYFLRVCLGDEDGGPLRQSFKVSHDKIFDAKFKNILNHGLQIAGRHYHFLGFSHSSLRMQTCWFVAPFISKEDGFVDDRRIISELGDFLNIQCPAKCAARIGQAFSDTPNTIKIDSHKIIPDIMRNGRVFSDGVGTIS